MALTYNKELRQLIKLLKGIPLQEVSTSDFNQERLIKWAKMHKVALFVLPVAKKADNLFSSGLVATLEQVSVLSAQRTLIQLSEMKRLNALMDREGICHVFIKGGTLSRMIYGKELFKVSGDIDILLCNPSDFSATHKMLENCGYLSPHLQEKRSELSRKLFLMAKREAYYINRERKCMVDLHIRPGANTYLTRNRFREFFTDLRKFTFEGSELTVPGNEKYLAYLCYHGALHQFSRLVWLMDIRAFLNNIPLNIKEVYVQAGTIGAERSMSLAILLLEAYFEDEVPDELKSIIVRSWRMNILMSMCTSMVDKNPGITISFKYRIRKFIYMMLLLKGLAAKIDYIIGILLRFIVKVL